MTEPKHMSDEEANRIFMQSPTCGRFECREACEHEVGDFARHIEALTEERVRREAAIQIRNLCPHADQSGDHAEECDMWNIAIAIEKAGKRSGGE